MKQSAFKSHDNTHDISVKIWPVDQPKAIIQLLHGISENIIRYDHVANFFNQRQITVIGHDHLGHGDSVNHSRELGFFGTERPTANLVNDALTLNQKISQNYPHLPIILLGHSMGSFIARLLVSQPQTHYDALMLFGTSGPRPELKCAQPILKTLNRLQPKQRNYWLQRHFFLRPLFTITMMSQHPQNF